MFRAGCWVSPSICGTAEARASPSWSMCGDFNALGSVSSGVDRSALGPSCKNWERFCPAAVNPRYHVKEKSR